MRMHYKVLSKWAHSKQLFCLNDIIELFRCGLLPVFECCIIAINQLVQILWLNMMVRSILRLQFTYHALSFIPWIEHNLESYLN